MNQIRTEMGMLRKLLRFYTFNTPIRRGVYRIALAGLRFGGPIPDRLLVTADDGRELVLNPADPGYKFVYFLGQYEPSITFFIRKAVARGDVCIDMGANLGWYTTLLMRLAGPGGEVHAFEPMHGTFRLLQKNVTLNDSGHKVYINHTALGDRTGNVNMQLESGLPDGHAAVSAGFSDQKSIVEASPITTLNRYLEEAGVGDVNFVKADIEGSELAALKGASRLFEQDIPPVFVIEMALATSTRFGYRPQDLLSFLNGKREYMFFAINEKNPQLTRIKGFAEGNPGANVLCVPAECDRERRNMLGIG